MTSARPMRMCDVCGGVDDHPRHIFAHRAGDAVTPPEVAVKALKNAGDEHQALILMQIQDSSAVRRHMDCCRDAGCPDGTCNFVTAGAENLSGGDLIKFLTN